MSETGSAMRRLLLRLKKGAQLRRAGGAFLLSGRRGPKAVVPPELVAALVSQGLVVESGDAVTLSATGERWLVDSAARHLDLDTRRIKDEAGVERYVVVNAAESALELLHRRGFVGSAAFEAGEKLRRDYTIGGLGPRLAADYSVPVGERHFRPDIAETVLAARQRFNLALKAAGPGLSEVLFDVCCYLMTLEECEANHRWPRGSARVVLLIALERLAAHYGMNAPASAKTRSWHL